MGEIFVRIVDLPYATPGLTQIDNNGDYNVYINSLLDESEQRSTLNHELSHIQSGDFSNDLDLQSCETSAHLTKKISQTQK